MRKLSLALFSLVFALFVSSAAAHHGGGHTAFVKGEMGKSVNPRCITKEDAESILITQRDNGFAAGSALLGDLVRSSNCYFTGQVVEYYVFERVSAVENVPFPSGAITMYVIKVENEGELRYLLATWDVEDPSEETQ